MRASVRQFFALNYPTSKLQAKKRKPTFSLKVGSGAGGSELPFCKKLTGTFRGQARKPAPTLPRVFEMI